ncbi:hypothetical protein [Frigoriglobus tundricola]|uniref:Uncharacterized protein n=1 Tax=Frigoriglobus tundricola TaxID=2774151 RepID=A0A6M5YIT0_9BACT|nr:hypothetical protein [Frigoriglobus tundricola]QJW93153.1 hypothetical protein FTUN_0658 [Frigoriglobus tundricola]
MTESETPTLTAVQIIELQRFEALIVENLRRGKPPTEMKPDANGIIARAFNVADMDAPAGHERETAAGDSVLQFASDAC